MKIKLLAVFLIMLVIAACTKDTYNTTPTLKFESVNGTIFPRTSVVNFKLTCTDKEGDISDTIWVKRFSKVTACQTSVIYFDSLKIPDFSAPKNVKAEFDLTYNYPGPPGPSLAGCSQQDDTVYFKFWMKDKAHHTSDTVQSPEIVLLKQ